MIRIGFALTAGWVGLILSSVCSPRRAQFQAPPQSLEYEDTGALEAVADNYIKIRDSKNDAWLLLIGDETKVTVTGEAEPDCLRAGLFVKFSGDVDKKGALQKEIDEIEITSAEGKASLGLFTVGEPDSAPRPVRNPGAGSFLIKGKLTSYRDGQLIVLAGSRRITGKTGDELSVTLNVDDPNVAQAGDTVKVKAWYYDRDRPVTARNVPGRALAEEITITLSKPLAFAGKKSRPSEKAARPATKSSRTSK